MAELLATEKHADLVYDIGMHRGEDTDFYLRKGFRVVSFEADPDNAAHCRARFAEFERRGQWTLVEGAILDLPADGSGPRTVSFYKNTGDTHWGTVNSDWAARNARHGTSSQLIEVAAVDFAAALQRHGMPHFMKIDLQGCEMTCVNALRRFRHRPDYLSLQSDKTSFARIRVELAALAELGYDEFQAVEQSELSSHQSPPQPAREGQFASHKFEFGSSGLFGAELPGRWLSRAQVLRRYRMIHLGYYLVGDSGIMKDWKFPGTWKVRAAACRLIRLFTHGAVPGWYDTHARLRRGDATR